MKITQKVILDLLPLYHAGEASEDSKKLVDDYLKEFPDFAKELDQFSKILLLEDIPSPLNPEDEMVLLKKTKRLLQVRSLLMSFAIFFSALPLTFTDYPWSGTEGFHWLWNNFPSGALISAIVALGFWSGYIFLKKRLKATAL
jgi:hypothetical protein